MNYTIISFTYTVEGNELIAHRNVKQSDVNGSSLLAELVPGHVCGVNARWTVLQATDRGQRAFFGTAFTRWNRAFVKELSVCCLRCRRW